MTTNESFQFFHENGYMVVENVLTEPDIQPVMDKIAEVVDAKVEALFQAGAITEKFENLPVETRWARICGLVPQRDRGWNREVFSEAVYALCTNSKLLDICQEAYLGAELTLNGDYWIRPKVPHEDITTIPWHQDSFYYNGADNDNFDYKILSIWIPLVDVDEQNGCLQVIPKSHEWGLIPYANNNGKMEPTIDVESRGEVVSAVMKKGDVFIFNQLTMHRSLPNVSDGVRWSIDIRYTPTGQSFSWHELTATGFEKEYPTLRVRSDAEPENVQTWEEWQEKRFG